jgi:hypothetical protein
MVLYYGIQTVEIIFAIVNVYNFPDKWRKTWDISEISPVNRQIHTVPVFISTLCHVRKKSSEQILLVKKPTEK